MFDVAMTPLQQETPFDFGQGDLLKRHRDMGLAIGNDHKPPMRRRRRPRSCIARSAASMF